MYFFVLGGGGGGWNGEGGVVKYLFIHLFSLSLSNLMLSNLMIEGTGLTFNYRSKPRANFNGWTTGKEEGRKCFI